MKKLPVWAVALIFSLIVTIVMLVYRFHTNPEIPAGLNIFVALVFGVLAFIVSFSFAATDKIEAEKGKFEIKGWRIIFYIIGLLTGIFNLLFWFIALGSYVRRGMETRKPSKVTFFGHHFQTFAFNWGVLMSCVILISIGAIYSEERITQPVSESSSITLTSDFSELEGIYTNNADRLEEKLKLLNELYDQGDWPRYYDEAVIAVDLYEQFKDNSQKVLDFFNENKDSLSDADVDVQEYSDVINDELQAAEKHINIVKSNVEFLSSALKEEEQT